MNYLKDFWHSSFFAKIILSALGVLTLSLLISLSLNTSYSENLTKAESENSSIIEERDELLAQVESYEAKINDQKKTIEKTQSELDTIHNDFNEYKESMEVYEELSKKEAENKLAAEKLEKENREKKEKEKKEKEAADKKAAKEKEKEEKKAAEEKVKKEKEEKKAAEERKKKEKAEAEKKKQEKEEAKGYETGLTYEDLARNPDNHVAKKVTFYGRVIQVMENDGLIQLRLAVDDNYNNVILVELTDDIISDGRILEDDYITVKGLSFGLYEYTATLGQAITIPAVIADIVER